LSPNRPAICRACPLAREVTETDVDCAGRGRRLSFASGNGACIKGLWRDAPRIGTLPDPPRPEPAAVSVAIPRDQWQLRIKAIAMFRREGDKGVGDTIANNLNRFRMFKGMGASDAFKLVMKKVGINCGCEDRQRALNARYPYPARRTHSDTV